MDDKLLLLQPRLTAVRNARAPTCRYVRSARQSYSKGPLTTSAHHGVSSESQRKNAKFNIMTQLVRTNGV